MPAPNPLAGTERGELYGLRVNILVAVTGVVSGTTGLTIPTPNVRNRDYTGFYDGPWPLISISSGTYRLDLISGGQPYNMGQTLARPNLYGISLESVIPAGSSEASEAVSAAQDDLIDLQDAIVAYFNHMPHRCLPTSYGPMAQRAGIPIMFRKVPTFKEAQGRIVVIKEGVIGVQGKTQVGQST